MRTALVFIACLAALPAAAQGDPGDPCGGVAGLPCGAGLSCNLPNPDVADALGVCEATAAEDETSMCTMQWDPVCGVDGRTYGNACSARVAKVGVAHDGEC